MEMDREYLEQLALTLEKKEKSLERSLIPLMKDDLRTYQACIEGIQKIFLEKGMIKEDPYNYEQKHGELSIPPTDPFPDSDKQTQFSIRFTAYVDQVDFLINFFSLNVNSMTLKVIKTVNGLITYVNWRDFSMNSSSIMTRITAQFMDRISQSEEQMTAKVLASSLSTLREKTKEVIKHLKQLTSYHRELYKLNIRRFIFPDLEVTPDEIEFKTSQAAMKVKAAIAKQGVDMPFFKELILEIFDEDYSSRKESLRSGILSSMHVQENTVKKKTEDPEVKLRKLVMNCIKALTITEPQLEIIYSKLRDNSRILQNQKLSFGQKVQKWLTHVFNSKKDFVEYDISYIDPFTNLKKAETLNFTDFLRTVQQKWTLYRSLTDSHSGPYQRAESSSLDQVYEFALKNVTDLKSMYRRLVGLDNYFKENVPQEEKSSIRGMKVEIATLKRGISTVVNDINEFKAFQEEMEQLKKLGVQ